MRLCIARKDGGIRRETPWNCFVNFNDVVQGYALRGDTLFQWIKVPAWDPSNKELREQVEDLHALLANTVFFLALLHAGVALAHHYVLRDGVLRRMLPGLSPRRN